MPVIAGTSAVGEIAEIYGGSVGGLKTPKQVWPRTPVILVSFRHACIPAIPWENFSEALPWGLWGTSRTRGRSPIVWVSSQYSLLLTRYVMGSKTAHAGIALPVWVSGLFSVLGKIGYGLCSQDRLWDPKIGRNFCRRSPPISAKIPPQFRPKHPHHFGQNTLPISPNFHLHFCPTLVAHFHRSKRNWIFFNIFLLY